jgi:hypothetical protein
MSCAASLAGTYVRVAFPNGLLASRYLLRVEKAFCNKFLAFSNIYPSFSDKPVRSVGHCRYSETQHHHHYGNGYSKNHSDAPQKQTSFFRTELIPRLLDNDRL